MPSIAKSIILSVAQWGGALAISVPAFFMLSWASALAPIVGFLAGTLAFFVLFRSGRPLRREEVRTLSTHAGLVSLIVGAVAYSAAYFTWRDAFEFEPSRLFLIAPSVGLMLALLNGAITLMCGDVWATVAQSDGLDG